MAKNTKGDGSLEQNGVTVVTHDNVGKGLVWNEETKQYEVALSKDQTNLIQLRDDGLYFGYTPERNVATLYIANSGNDDNDGTRGNPIRTLHKAAELIKDTPAVYSIFLHEGDTFELSHNFYKRYVSVDINAYGSQSDTIYPPYTAIDPFFRGYMAKNLNRPILKASVDKTGNIYRRSTIIANEISIKGVHIKVDNTMVNDDGVSAGAYTGVIDGKEVKLFGCIVERLNKGSAIQRAKPTGLYRDDVLLRGNVLWCNCELRGIKEWLAHYAYTDLFKISDWNTGLVRGSAGVPDYIGLISEPNPIQFMENQVTPAITKTPSSGNVMR